MDHQRFRNIGLGVLVVAVVLLGFGGWQARSLLWETTEGRIESCTQSGQSGQSTQVQQCLVTWTASGKPHAATVSFDGTTDLSHTSQTLDVDGDDAYLESPGNLGPLLLGAGLVLAVTGIFLRRKGNRAQ
jgi:hypothetical protein